MSDESTSLKAGQFDVRTILLNIIGNRKEGISYPELMRKMHEIMEWKVPFYYETTLAALVEEGQVCISHYGIENHKIRVYSLRVHSQYEKTCRICKKTKPAMTFRKRADAKDGYVNLCKLCENKERKIRGWANKSRRRRLEELRKGKGIEDSPPNQPRVILKQEEIDAAASIVKAESLEDYRQKYVGRSCYVVVDGKVLPARRELSPVEEYDRAWRRIKQTKCI